MNIRTLTKKLKAKYTFVGGEQHRYNAEYEIAAMEVKRKVKKRSEK